MQLRIENVQRQKMLGDNVYQFLLYFDKLYDKFTDVEKKHFPVFYLIQDMGKAYQKVIQDLYDAGCRNLQLDDCSWGLFFGQKLTEESKVFANQLLEVNNLAVAKAPSDMVINTHICRGNYNSDYFGQGAYDSVAKIIFGDENIDYGIFPYTSSSSTISAYGPIGAGIPEHTLNHVVGVLKAYSTCVGAGPFAAENAMTEKWMEMLRKIGGEYGAATGRPRRVGPFDAVASRYGLKCQNADKIALTKLDVLSTFPEIPVITGYRCGETVTDTFDTMADMDAVIPIVEMLPGWQQDISKCRSFQELPQNARDYVECLERLLKHEIQFISVGARRDEYILKGEWL